MNDDLISRQVVKDAINEHLEVATSGLGNNSKVKKIYKMSYNHVIDVISILPAIQPNPEKDRQESKDYCAECDHVEMCNWYPHDGCEFRETKTKQKTGRWIYTDTIGGMRFYGCSNCDNQEKDCIANEHEIQWYNYCPNCGAKMKRESEDYKNNE